MANDQVSHDDLLMTHKAFSMIRDCAEPGITGVERRAARPLSVSVTAFKGLLMNEYVRRLTMVAVSGSGEG